jgi:undecaprenyl-diphosphatase
MKLWFAALLGFVQGLTEFLPISSNAHLRITAAVIHQPDPGAAFTAVIQLGSLLAVMAYFVRELVAMVRAVATDRSSPDARLAGYLIVGTIPVAVLGILLRKHIEHELRSLWVICAALILIGGFMWIADRTARHARGIADLTMRDALIVGLGQACALVPGASRSGSTLTTALFLGMKRDDAARFSFLLSVPAIGGAGLFELKKQLPALKAIGATPILVGTLVAAIVSYASIAWLLRWLRTRSLVPFAIYRIVLACALIGGLLTHRI